MSKKHVFRDFVSSMGGVDATAKALGISEHTVRSYMQGARNMRPDLAATIEQLSGGKIDRCALIWDDKAA